MPTRIKLYLGAAALFCAILQSAFAAATPEEALQQLRVGQGRFLAGKPLHPNQDAERRAAVAAGQTPIATVLTCSDSRVPAELIFDQGIGDLFTVRVAGNVVDVDEVATIEYGVGHLNTPLLVVMGHSNCGAVKAALSDDQAHGSLPALIDKIGPAVAQARAAKPTAGAAALLAEAVKINVWVSIDELFKRSAPLRELVKGGKLKVVGAVYDISTGSVELLGSHPEQGRLLAYQEDALSHDGTATHAETSVPSKLEGVVPAAIEYSSMLRYWIAGSVAVLVLVLGGAWHFSKSGMKKWTIGRRIATGFVAVLLVLAAVAYFGYAGLHEAFGEFSEYRSDARHSNLAGRIQANFLEMRIAAKDLVIFRTKESIDRYHARKDKLLQFVKEGESQIVELNRLTSLKTMTEHVAQHVALHGKLTSAVLARKDAIANEINKQMGAVGALIDHEAEGLKLEFIAEQDQAGPRANFKLLEAQRIIVVVCLAAFALGTGLSLIIAHSITRPLQGITGGLSDGAEEVLSAAGQVSSSAQSLAEGASESAASLEETSASLEEVTSMTKRNADNAAQAKELSAQTRVAADTGAADMVQMKGAMDAIKQSSGEIAKIVKTIDEIAFQTNILALNAAVEAARAGEAGMGFAVVAEEVRALAQRSAQAAKETAAKIEDSVNKSEHGVHISAKVAASLQQIVDRARKVDALVAEIATASSEQSQGISQVNTAVSQLDQVTQSNAGSAEESAAAAEELNAQSAELRRIVGDLGMLVGAFRRTAASSAPAASPSEPQTAPKLRATAIKASKTTSFTAAGSIQRRPATSISGRKAALVSSVQSANDEASFFKNL